MTNELNRDLMIAMLRRGSTGDEMLNILNENRQKSPEVGEL